MFFFFLSEPWVVQPQAQILWSTPIADLAELRWSAASPDQLSLQWENDSDDADDSATSHQSSADEETIVSFPTLQGLHAFALDINKIWHSVYDIDISWQML